MYFDALTLAAIAEELRTTILGGRIQRVVLPNQFSVALEVYAHHQRHQLLASAHPQFARVHLLSQKPSRGLEQPTPLLLLLRKYILGGRIVSIEQPDLERILVLSIVKERESRNSLEATSTPLEPEPPSDADLLPADHPKPIQSTELIIEPMERRSNIILVDDNNVILESVKRVTTRMSQRVVLPRQPYESPPGQDKYDPRTAIATELVSLRALKPNELAKALVAGYRGVSPQAAREVVYRAVGQTAADLYDDTLPWDTIAACLRELYTTPAQPTLIQDEAQPRAYAPYLLQHLRGALPQPTMSAAIETYYAAREVLTDHRQRRDAVRLQLDETRQRLQRQFEQIEQELERTANLEHLRWEGEMILAFLHELAPYQTQLEVDGKTIALDPERSPVEQAQARFRTYQRGRSGQETLQERHQTTTLRLAALEQLVALLAVADEREQIEQIALEAVEQGLLEQPKQAKKKTKGMRYGRRKPLHLVSSDGFDIFVGRSANQNVEVTFQIGRPEDYWLHVRTIPGAHVIIRNSGRDVPERTLQEAAGLAAYFSQARSEPAVDVEISRRKQVRKVRGGPPGLVTYQAERTIRVPPLPPWA